MLVNIHPGKAYTTTNSISTAITNRRRLAWNLTTVHTFATLSIATTNAAPTFLGGDEPQLTEIHVKVVAHHGHVLVLQLLRFGLDIELGDVTEDLGHAVELADCFGYAAYGGQRLDEFGHAAEVVNIGCFNDVAEEDYKWGEGSVDEGPVVLFQSVSG